MSSRTAAMSGMAKPDTGRPPTSFSFLWSLGYGLGMVLVFLGERASGGGSSRVALTSAGLAVAVVATAARAFRMRMVDRRAHATGAGGVEKVLLGLGLLGLLALAVYFFQSDVIGRYLDRPLGETAPRLAVVLRALWPVVLACSLLPMLMVEVSYLAMARAAVIEAGRVRSALNAGLGLSFALVFAFATIYVATHRDPRWDLSYFRTAKPGEATRNIVRALQEPLEVALFFPPANEVKEQVQDYFDLLKDESPFLKVNAYDQAVDVAKAGEMGVTANGFVAFARGGRKELFSLGQQLEGARTHLRNLDQEAQKRILQVGRARQTLFFVTGHGERSELNARADDKRATIHELRTLLRAQNHELADLGASTGLASGVPENAAALLIIGPTSRFLPEEVATIAEYVHGGGRLFLALDPEAGLSHDELLRPFGLKVTPSSLASDRIYVRTRHQPSDQINIVTATYSSHPSVTTLSRMGARAPMLFMGAGPLEDASPQRAPGLSIDYTVRADPSTWLDLDGDFAFDAPTEVRKPWQLAAAITYKKSRDVKAEDEGRAVILGDSDLLTDAIIRYQGPAYFTLDSMKWLLGDEAIQGTINSEADLPIQHTRKDDARWFYSTIFLAPALVVGAGLLITRRRGGRR